MTQKKYWVFLLVLYIQINHRIVKSQDDEDVNDLSSDTRDFVRNLTNETERKIYIDLARRKSNLFTKAPPRIPLLYAFQCAADIARNALEHTYLTYKSLRKHDLPPTPANLTFPPDILHINNTRDGWINLIRPPKYNRSTWILNSVFKNWYSFVKSQPNKPATRKTINELRVELGHYYDRNRDSYQSLDDVYVRFAAHSARSFTLFCAVCSNLIKLLKEKIAQQSGREFSDILFDVVPSWCVFREQLEFLNILVKINTPQRVYNPIQYFVARNRWREAEGKGDYVLVPYGNESSCGGQNMMYTSTTPATGRNVTFLVDKSA